MEIGFLPSLLLSSLDKTMTIVQATVPFSSQKQGFQMLDMYKEKISWSSEHFISFLIGEAMDGLGQSCSNLVWDKFS